MSSGINIVSEFSGQELTTACLAERLSLVTFVVSSSPVLLNSTEDLSTWLQGASPASHSQTQGSALVPPTNATCGQPPLNASAWFDRDSHCWRMSQTSFLVDISEPFSQTWPRQGMTHDGLFFLLAPLERHIHEKGCSYWPTPNAADHKVGFNNLIEAKRAANKERRASGYLIQRRVVYDYLVRFGKPCPAIFYEWLMGIPIGATGLKPLAMDRCLLWLQQHGIR